MLLTKKIVRHSLLWLFLGNLVGLILSLLLLFPEYNIAPYTFGRLVPLHLNFLLYGWSALPLVALLFQWYLPDGNYFQSLVSKIVLLWSCCLAFAGGSWLLGHSSGKLFLEWEGAAQYFYIFILALLWFVFTTGYMLRVKNDALLIRVMKVLLLILLGATPIALNFAFRPDIFPPINPASSGATGASLLASSLGVVAIFLLMPFSIQIPIREKFFFWPYFALLMLHLYFWLSISHGHTSNHEMPQILGLASMLVWVPLLFFYYRKFDWGNYLWVYSFAFWGSLLVPTAVITFLPYNLEAAKFTSLLVAHVHIAMAGMTTSFAALILSNLLRSKKMTDIFCSKKDYFLWQVGLILHLLALALLGIREVNQRHFLFSGEFASFFPLTLRVVAGALMTYSSLRWLCSRIDYE